MKPTRIGSVQRNRFVVLLIAFIMQMLSAAAQGEFILPRTNSSSTLIQTIASTRIEITYNRPNKRGRKVFGDLVPHGALWRTGSDETTKLYFSTPVMVEGHALDSGRYELFTIPGPMNWEIILTKNKNQWGAYSYQPESDDVRFVVTPNTASRTVETFTILMDDIGADHGRIHILWDTVDVSMEVKIDLQTTVIPRLEENLAKAERPSYFHAAMFYFENDIDIPRAAAFMARALEQHPGHIGMLYRQALILQRKGDIPQAIEAAQQSLDGALHTASPLREEYIQLNTQLLESLKSERH